MVFSSAIFLLQFLPVVFLVNYFIKDRFSNVFLLVASLFFYAWGEPVMVLLMIFSVLVNWAIGLMISKSIGAKKGIILFLGVMIDLCALGYYKYADFFYTKYSLFSR